MERGDIIGWIVNISVIIVALLVFVGAGVGVAVVKSWIGSFLYDSINGKYKR